MSKCLTAKLRKCFKPVLQVWLKMIFSVSATSATSLDANTYSTWNIPIHTWSVCKALRNATYLCHVRIPSTMVFLLLLQECDVRDDPHHVSFFHFCSTGLIRRTQKKLTNEGIAERKYSDPNDEKCRSIMMAGFRLEIMLKTKSGRNFLKFHICQMLLKKLILDSWTKGSLVAKIVPHSFEWAFFLS